MSEGDVTQSPLSPDILQQLAGGLGPASPQAMTPGAPPPQAPQQSPIGPTTPFDLASTVRQVSQLPEYQQASGRLEQIGGQEQAIQQKMAGMQPPKMGWLDTQGQPQQGGFLHTLGRALMAIGAATTPGQRIQEAQYGPGVSRYGTQQRSLAEQLSALKQQETIPTEELRATTGLTQAAGMAGYRSGMLDVRNREADIKQQRADDYGKSVQNNFQKAMAGLDLQKLKTGSQVELNKFRERLMNMQTELGPQKLEMEKYGIDTNNATRLAAANVMATLGIDKTHPVAQMIDNILGTSMTPAAPQVPGGAQPVSGATPLPPRKSAAPKGGATKFMSGGKAYNIPAGMENDFLKDHPDAKRQ